MRRIKIVGVALVAVAAMGGAAASASAIGLDWTVNGVPLKEGQSVKVTVGSLTTTQIAVPASKLTFVCTSLSGKGALIGGKEGTGTVKSKLLGCYLNNKECPVKVKTFGLANGEDATELYQTWHIEPRPVRENSGDLTFRTSKSTKPGCPPNATFNVEGLADSEVPGPNEAILVFPEAPLPLSSLTVNGAPAVWSGSYEFKLTKGGTLGEGEL